LRVAAVDVSGSEPSPGQSSRLSESLKPLYLSPNTYLKIGISGRNQISFVPSFNYIKEKILFQKCHHIYWTLVAYRHLLRKENQ